MGGQEVGGLQGLHRGDLQPAAHQQPRGGVLPPLRGHTIVVQEVRGPSGGPHMPAVPRQPHLHVQEVRGHPQEQLSHAVIRRALPVRTRPDGPRQHERKRILQVTHIQQPPKRKMIMTDETVRALHGLKLPGMAGCWTSLEETHRLDKLSLRDGMQLMLQHERDTRQANRIARLIKNAGFRLKATMEELETDTTRGIPAAEAADLATGGYIRDGRTIIICGPTGTGKSYFACALGERACRQGIKTLYFTMNMLIENLRLVRLEGREANFFRKLSDHGLVIIDDFGMVRLEGQKQHDFEQIIDDRYNRKALILTSQLPVADWYGVFQSELIAEACLDRIAHKSRRFSLSGESLRKKY